MDLVKEKENAMVVCYYINHIISIFLKLFTTNFFKHFVEDYTHWYDLHDTFFPLCRRIISVICRVSRTQNFYETEPVAEKRDEIWTSGSELIPHVRWQGYHDSAVMHLRNCEPREKKMRKILAVSHRTSPRWRILSTKYCATLRRRAERNFRN